MEHLSKALELRNRNEDGYFRVVLNLFININLYFLWSFEEEKKALLPFFEQKIKK